MALLSDAVAGSAICWVFFTTGVLAFQTQEHVLRKHLLTGYNNEIRPTLRPVDTVNVSMDISLTQIIEFDMRKQQLAANLWLRQYWTDEHLKWNASEYGDVTVITLSADLVWTPDITLYNDVSNEKYMGDLIGGFKLRVSSDGSVQWLAPIVTTSSCTLDVTYFPWDVQHCHLQYGSWSYDSAAIDLFNRTSEVGLRYYVEHGEWELVRTNVRRQVDKYTCCVNTFPAVFFEFTLRRQALFHVINIILPGVFIMVTSLLSFCLPPDSGEKISLAVTILLATAFILLLVSETMPVQSAKVPYMAQFFLSVMIIMTLSTVLSVTVLIIHHKGVHDHKVPAWAKRIFFDFIGPALGLKGSVSRYTEKHKKQSVQISYRRSIKEAALTQVIEKMDLTKLEEMSNKSRGADGVSGSSLRDIQSAVESINDRFSNQMEEQQSRSEWIMLAIILDRLYFVFILLLIVVFSIIFLIMPGAVWNQ